MFVVARSGTFRTVVAPLRCGYAVPAGTPATSSAVNQRTAKIFEVHDETELEEMVKDPTMEGTLVLDCYADWCGPCRKLSPMLEAEVNKNNKVRLAKLNVDQMETFPAHLKVSAIPAVFAFYKGNIIAKFVGCPQPHELHTWITNVADPEPLLKH